MTSGAPADRASRVDGTRAPVGVGDGHGILADAEWIHLSAAARRILDPAGADAVVSQGAEGSQGPKGSLDASVSGAGGEVPAAAPGDRASGERRLSKSEVAEVAQLKVRDTEVRVHEAAHASAAGGLGGRPALEYATGPDGQRYAVSGEVSIDTSPGRTPEETIARARTIRAAATAPADPSAQDMAVASAAARMEAEAVSEIFQMRAEAQTKAAPHAVPATTDGRATGARDAGPPGAPGSQTTGQADAERTMRELTRERSAVQGGRGHNHSADGCAFCSVAVRAYG